MHFYLVMASFILRASMDVVSSHVSYNVNSHQCSYSSCNLHCYSNVAGAHSVVDPVKGRKGGRINYLVVQA